MKNIDYSWQPEDLDENEVLSNRIECAEVDGPSTDAKLSSRHNLQIMRRLFHMFNGVAIATLYLISFNHAQMVHFLGTIACVLYVIEQVRINYPETAAKLLPITRFIIRAEEQLKESAMVPYAFAVLLTIITFPKAIALVGIYTLAIADPLSAIVGIRFGKRKIAKNRTLEGSSAFFISTFLVSLFVLSGFEGSFTWMIFFISFLLASAGTFFETLPLKIDDNLTIPLFISFALWIICGVLGVTF